MPQDRSQFKHAQDPPLESGAESAPESKSIASAGQAASQKLGQEAFAKSEAEPLQQAKVEPLQQAKLFGEGIVSGLALNSINGATQFSNESFGTNFKAIHLGAQSEIDSSIAGNVGKMIGTTAIFIGLALATKKVTSLSPKMLGSAALSESVAFGTAGAIQGGLLTPTQKDLSGSSFFLARGGEALLGSGSAVLGAQGARVAKLFQASAPSLGVTGSRLLSVGAEGVFNGGLGAGTAHAYSYMQTGKWASNQEVATSAILSAGIGLGASALSFHKGAGAVDSASERALKRTAEITLKSTAESALGSTSGITSETILGGAIAGLKRHDQIPARSLAIREIPLNLRHQARPQWPVELERARNNSDKMHFLSPDPPGESSSFTTKSKLSDVDAPRKDAVEPSPAAPPRISITAADFKKMLLEKDLKDIPRNIDVIGNLNLREADITSLPEGLHVSGDLDLMLSRIESLPEGLYVGGDIDLRATGIKSLPEGFHVGGSLNLSVTRMTSLPKGLHVGDSLCLHGSAITSLPEGLHVGNSLDISGTRITSLPDGLHLGGSLMLRGSSVKSLPEGLHVGGDLDLFLSRMTSLPEGLYVGGDLDLKGSSITSLPEGLYVGERILLDTNALSPVRAMSKVHSNLSEQQKTSILKAIKDSMGVDSIEELTQEEFQSVTGLIRSLKTKTFQKMVERLEAGNPDNSSWSTHGALGLVNTFGNDSPQWLDLQTKAGRSLHDASFWLPIKSPKELQGLDTWLRRNYKYSQAGEDTLRPIEDLSVVAQNWAELNSAQRELSYKDLLSLVKSGKYVNQADELFASESAKWGIAPSDYKAIENRYLASLSTKVPFPTEQRWNEGEFIGRFLPRKDPRGLYLGQHTDCCQHPKGAGATSAWYGQESPNSGFFVVEDKNGQVVAQSLAWLSDDGAVVFDNIEAKALGDREAKVAAIYQKVGDSLAQSHYKVTIGSGESDVDLSRWKATDAVPLPRDSTAYTDAKSQVLLSANANIKPAPISKLNNWVQGLWPSDKAQIEKIAKAVYPEGRPLPSEGDFGLVLKDKNEGTIGYAKIDRENNEIKDIAVLPEHRNQSRLLINALFDHIRRVGGDWTADLRESSSYKVLKAYEKWGRVEILEDNVSGSMGSDQVHSVKLRLPERSK
ncbi:MAG: hypothetical protein Q8T09_01985 [Candidatus Melainabacteria bacterium]|nr:hypothetical protein [Candidatus Melainabacteria bacterium]